MKLLIGSTNPAKQERWKAYFSEYQLYTPEDLGITLDIVEDGETLEQNAQKKAITYAKKANMLTLSDDTGFFIDELGGLPGVKARRWGGKFPDNISDEEYFSFITKEVEKLNNTSAYFEFCVALAKPEGDVITLSNKFHGQLDKTRLHKRGLAGYPMSYVFVIDDIGKSWSEMTSDERYEYEKDFVETIKQKLQVMQC